MNVPMPSTATHRNAVADASHLQVTPRAPYSLKKICRDAVVAESGALLDYSERLGQEFIDALDIIHASSGPLIVAGIGKSGHIAKKIASTFSSIGKPSVFVHAAEASHGDLGLVQANCAGRSEERSVGKEWVSAGRSRGSPAN